MIEDYHHPNGVYHIFNIRPVNNWLFVGRTGRGKRPKKIYPVLFCYAADGTMHYRGWCSPARDWRKGQWRIIMYPDNPPGVVDAHFECSYEEAEKMLCKLGEVLLNECA